MSLVVFISLIFAQHVSNINMSIFRKLRLWSLVVSVLQVETLVLQPAKRTPPNISRSKTSNTQRTENKTIDVVIHEHSRRLLKMDILMSETCWAHNKWTKIASDIKLIFHSSTTYGMLPIFFLPKKNLKILRRSTFCLQEICEV